MRISASKLEALRNRVCKELGDQGVDQANAVVILEDSVNGIRVSLIPNVWIEREQLGARQDGEPKPVCLGYW